MRRSFSTLIPLFAGVVFAVGCQHEPRLDSAGNPLPIYVGPVVQYPPEPPHFEPEGQTGWANLTEAKPGEMAEPKRIDLKDLVGKRLTVEGLLMPGTGWIYQAEILKEEK